MSLDVEVDSAGARAPLGRERVERLVRAVLRAERVPHARVSVAFVSSPAIAAINRRYLGHRGPTDVISFPLAPAAPGEPLGGDIYIAPDVARANARRHGVPVREETARLVIHGTLHILGYEHPEDDRRETAAMWRRQERLLRGLSREWQG
jgi:probable rRNA maturation factor